MLNRVTAEILPVELHQKVGATDILQCRPTAIGYESAGNQVMASVIVSGEGLKPAGTILCMDLDYAIALRDGLSNVIDYLRARGN